jgi:hypothetical protein
MQAGLGVQGPWLNSQADFGANSDMICDNSLPTIPGNAKEPRYFTGKRDVHCRMK